MIHHSAYIHHKAHVDVTCRVGAGTKIWQFASVTRGTVLGEDCIVWPFAMLDGPIIGDRCKIASGVAMGPGFKIGNDVFIGPNVVLCNDMWPETSTEGYDEAHWRSGEEFAVIVEDNVAISAGAIILPGVRIRSGSVIAAGAIVAKSVGSDLIVGRNYIEPLKVLAQRRHQRMRIAL